MDKTNKVLLTPEGRQKLLDELAWREGEKRDEIVELIREARSYGDLSENAEFDSAKEEQSKNESRILEIQKILASSEMVSNDQIDHNNLSVSVNCVVELEDEKGKTVTYTIVGSTETNSLEHKISNDGPLGEALMGHKAGDTIEFATPSGKVRSCKILMVRLRNEA